MIIEILSRKWCEHGDVHLHRVLVKLIFTQGLSARRDQGEEGMMVVLVSTGHCAFLLSHTPGLFLACWWISFSAHDSTAESGGQFTHAHNSDHCMSFQSRAEAAMHKPTTYK